MKKLSEYFQIALAVIAGYIADGLIWIIRKIKS